MTAPRDISYEVTLLPMLTDPDEAAAYLYAAFELNEHNALAVALQQVADIHHDQLKLEKVVKRLLILDSPAYFARLGQDGLAMYAAAAVKNIKSK